MAHVKSVSIGEFVGDVAGPHSQFHGGEERGLLVPGARGQVLLEHGQLQRRHGVPRRAEVTLVITLSN